jgi:hypothetical protein
MGTQDLDCGDYQFFIAERGGLERYFLLRPVINWRWNRTRDAISEAFIDVSTESPECCYYMERMECGRHELVIERNAERVWEGPLTRLGFHRSYVEIEAHDVMHYAYKAIMKSRYNNAYPHIDYAVNRANKILTTELARFESMTPPINVTPYIRKFGPVTGDAKSSRNTKAYQRMAWEEIDEMAARGGIDYAVIGDHHAVRRGQHHRQDQAADRGRLRGRDRGHQYGMELATHPPSPTGRALGRTGTRTRTRSTGGGSSGVAVRAGRLGRKKTIQTVAEMTTQAKRNASHRYPCPVVVRVPDGAQLDPRSGLLLSDLVPGVRIPLTATLTCREVRQEQKLDKVQVEGAEGVESFKVIQSRPPARCRGTTAGTRGPS